MLYYSMQSQRCCWCKLEVLETACEAVLSKELGDGGEDGGEGDSKRCLWR
jgi:hypothetical protein